MYYIVLYLTYYNFLLVVFETFILIGVYRIEEFYFSTSRMAQQKRFMSKWATPETRFGNIDGVKSLSAACSKFSIASYKHLTFGNNENMFFSPVSISTALCMVYVGAQGKTSQEMASCLQIAGLGDDVHELFRDLFQTIQNGDHEETGYTLKAANRLFASKDYNFLEQFVNKCHTFYHTDAQSMDFKGDAETSRKNINDWVKDETENKIKEIIPSGMINDATVMILVNAIYFKGDWMNPFDKALTEPMTFYASHGEIQVNMMKMMSKDIRSNTDNELDCTYVDLEYGNKEMSMTILLPNKLDGLQALEEQLTHDKLETMLKQMYTGRFEVTLHLPRFKMDYEKNLNDMLSSTGMETLFTDQADLSGMDGTRSLSVSVVVHKAFVEVNEEGTEAAAATGVGIALMSMPSMPSPLLVKCDHPFLFLIRERASGSIIFMGRLMNPDS